ncbi:MAG: Crp/Fnr family transcriptional regulator [Clostridia bacterium]|nr:Crp/Fnr family transcriptional regulator [Clostridia bacterium]
MEKYIPILSKTRLFEGLNYEEIASLLNCLQAKTRAYTKGEYVFNQGDRIKHITLLLEGELHIRRDDYWGERSIINAVGVGEMFGEAYATDLAPIPNDVVATRDSVVIFLDVNKIITTCGSNCSFHSSIIRNLFLAISERNRGLVGKLGILSERTTRNKLMAYLSSEAKRQKSPCFSIPFNRQQLADFLLVDRSALSNELCKMRDEGLIKFRKNEFILL